MCNIAIAVFRFFLSRLGSGVIAALCIRKRSSPSWWTTFETIIVQLEIFDWFSSITLSWLIQKHRKTLDSKTQKKQRKTPSWLIQKQRNPWLIFLKNTFLTDSKTQKNTWLKNTEKTKKNTFLTDSKTQKNTWFKNREETKKNTFLTDSKTQKCLTDFPQNHFLDWFKNTVKHLIQKHRKNKEKHLLDWFKNTEILDWFSSKTLSWLIQKHRKTLDSKTQKKQRKTPSWLIQKHRNPWLIFLKNTFLTDSKTQKNTWLKNTEKTKKNTFLTDSKTQKSLTDFPQKHFLDWFKNTEKHLTQKHRKNKEKTFLIDSKTQKSLTDFPQNHFLDRFKNTEKHLIQKQRRNKEKHFLGWFKNTEIIDWFSSKSLSWLIQKHRKNKKNTPSWLIQKHRNPWLIFLKNTFLTDSKTQKNTWFKNTEKTKKNTFLTDSKTQKSSTDFPQKHFLDWFKNTEKHLIRKHRKNKEKHLLDWFKNTEILDWFSSKSEETCYSESIHF